MRPVGTLESGPHGEVIEGADEIWIARFSREARRLIKKRVAETPVDDTLKELWEKTTAEGTGEVDLGWAEGPYTEDEVSDILGDDLWVASRRFGVVQKDKLRQIDRSFTSTPAPTSRTRSPWVV